MYRYALYSKKRLAEAFDIIERSKVYNTRHRLRFDCEEEKKVYILTDQPLEEDTLRRVNNLSRKTTLTLEGFVEEKETVEI